MATLTPAARACALACALALTIVLIALAAQGHLRVVPTWVGGGL
jgi:hypothetical protein